MIISYDEFDYEPSNEKLWNAKHHIIKDIMQWEIKRVKGYDYKFTEEELKSLDVVTHLIAMGDLGEIENFEERYYDEIKEYFEDIIAKEDNEISLQELEEQEYRSSIGVR